MERQGLDLQRGEIIICEGANTVDKFSKLISRLSVTKEREKKSRKK